MENKINTEIVVVIPTYNAREGIIDTMQAIQSAVPAAGIIVVDDNSPDKTADLVLSKFKDDKRVFVYLRIEKGGRGSAVVAGLREGLKNKKAKYFIEMDADLCHNPKYIKQMVQQCKTADVVIASRYLPASNIYGWNLKRKLMSFAINTFAKLLLRVPIRDYTDGFRCYSRKAVEFICSYKLQSRGYIVLSEIAYLCYKNGFIFAEIPIDFYFKPVSKSNLNLNEAKEAIMTIIRLRFIQNE